MRKKVMFLMTGLHYGGMERVVFIAHSLLKEDYDISIVTLYSNNADYKPDFEYIDLKCPPRDNKILKYLNVIKRTHKVKRIKKELKPDIVMSFGTAANFANVFSKDNEKVIVGIRSYDWLTNYFTNYSIDKKTYNKADMVVSVSKVIANDAERLFKLDKTKSKVLYNPYDVRFIQEKANEPINEINLDNEENILVSVGRLVNQKGYNHLIKAFSIVVREFPDTRLLIIGHGSKQGELNELINKLGISKNVVLLGGQSNPYKFMKRAKLYILSSLTEGFPNAMVEAMSIGIPILAVDCKSGPREILSLGSLECKCKKIEMCDYGVITPEVTKSFDYSYNKFEECDYTLAESIKVLLRDESIRKKYSQKSYERANEFTYDKFKNNLINIFESL